jgi:hypothetical protein
VRDLLADRRGLAVFKDPVAIRRDQVIGLAVNQGGGEAGFGGRGGLADA